MAMWSAERYPILCQYRRSLARLLGRPNMDRLSMVQLGGLGDQRTFIMSGRIPQFGDAQEGLRKPRKPYARQDLPRECGLRSGYVSRLISGRHRHRLAE